jgi:hypothetical protein
MQVFNTIDSSSFRYNGLKYAKNFMIIPQGVTGLGIYNAFDTSLQLIASAKFSDVQIDGIVYSSQTACVDVLAALIFYKLEQLVLVQLQMLLIVLMVKLVL